MQGTILGLLAETHIHPGAGQSEGAVDLPVAREKTTDYPFVPGSGVKGAMRDLAERRGFSAAVKEGDVVRMVEKACDAAVVKFDKNKAEKLAREIEEQEKKRDKPLTIEEKAQKAAWLATSGVYGEADAAGNLLLSDAKLLLLPVRCLSRCYLWLTCPHLIERYQRDRQRVTGEAPKMFDGFGALATGDPPPILCAGTKGEKLFLEERLFARRGDIPDGLVEFVSPLVGHEEAKKRLPEQLAVVTNDDFAWFARYALPVHAHNVLDENKTSKNLWYEETLAPDTLFYSVALFRNGNAENHIENLFFTNGGHPYLQLGGNETVGQGWFHVTRVRS
ncbi:MAG TPA: type III-B CRISPR module RAMP protein Cmr4 [Rhodospirillales bacterium]|nr:type III-B CRISPR module RAMP protein Cmr4 [Rhodospirillales bacterium]